MIRGVAAAAGLALALTLAGCRDGGASDPAAVASTAVAAPDGRQRHAVVTASRGKVELLRGSTGSWSAAKVGDRLGATDALRTEIGEADLAIDGVRLHLHDASQLELQHVEDRRVRARMRGSLESDVDDRKAQLDVEIEGSSATAHSDGGHFFVNSDGKGVVAVASIHGSVRLSSGGKSVNVDRGEVSRVAGTDAPPRRPSAALRRVLLSVKWPDQKETNQPTLPVTGRVDPGSRVFVQGQPIAVGPSGSFRTNVALRHGRQKVAVLTIDALGRKKHVESIVLRDDTLPDARVRKKLWQRH